MAVSRRFRGRNSITVDAPPIVRLWALRLLVLLNGQREFVQSCGFSDDALAEFVGMGKWVDHDGDDFDRKKVQAELRRLHRAAEEDAASHHVSAPLASNVQRLAQLSGFSEAECRILEFIVLLKNERLLEEAADLLGRLNAAQVQTIIGTVLGLSSAVVGRALSSKGNLCRTGLITVDSSATYSLSSRLDLISNRFASEVCSRETDPIDLFRDTVVPGSPPMLQLSDYEHISASLELLQPYLQQAMETRKRGVNIFLYGVPGTGKTQLARVLAAEIGCELFEITSEDEDGDPIDGKRRLCAYRASQNLFEQRQVLLVFDEAEDVFDDADARYGKATAQTRKAWVNHMLEDNAVPTLWISNNVHCLDPAYVRRFDMVIELPIPPKAQRKRIIQTAAAGLLDDDAIGRMAESTRLAPAVVARAADVARTLQAQLGEQGAGQAVEHLVNATLEAQRHAPIAKRHSTAKLSDTYDPAFINADVDLQEVAAGLARAGAGRICLYGPPGTGKTAYGRWLAEQLERPLLVKRGSDLLSMWVGGTEQNIANAFREAAREKAVLLIDEVDGFLLDRRTASHSWEITGVNEMLTQMETFDGVFIASTNLVDNLDQATLRRFDLKAKLDFLQADQLCELFARYCATFGISSVSPDINRQLAALRNSTPGDFAAIARQHRFRSLGTAQLVLDALRAECELKEGSPSRIGFL